MYDMDLIIVFPEHVLVHEILAKLDWQHVYVFLLDARYKRLFQPEDLLFIAERRRRRRTCLQGVSLLFRIARAGHVPCFIKALHRGHSFLDDGEHVHALRVASLKGHARIVDELLAGGVANVQDPYRKDLDDRASTCSSAVEVLVYAQEKGYRISCPVNDSLILASGCGHMNVVRCFESHGLLSRTPALMNAMAINACIYGHIGVLEEISSHVEDEDKCGCLIIAAKNGHVDVVRYLIDIGTDPDAFQRSALKMARLYGHREIEKFITTRRIERNSGAEHAKKEKTNIIVGCANRILCALKNIV